MNQVVQFKLPEVASAGVIAYRRVRPLIDKASGDLRAVAEVLRMTNEYLLSSFRSRNT